MVLLGSASGHNRFTLPWLGASEPLNGEWTIDCGRCLKVGVKHFSALFSILAAKCTHLLQSAVPLNGDDLDANVRPKLTKPHPPNDSDGYTACQNAPNKQAKSTNLVNCNPWNKMWDCGSNNIVWPLLENGPLTLYYFYGVWSEWCWRCLSVFITLR